MIKNHIVAIIISLALLLSGCQEDRPSNSIRFGISADYPPFEYQVNGELQGLDVDLARLIAKKLGKQAVFDSMQFSVIFAALQNGTIDAAISTITITEERQKNFDFSTTYYTEKMAIVYPKHKPITDKAQLANKKIACQLGTTMEIWLKKHTTDVTIVPLDTNNQAIEALKVGHVDGVLIDGAQGATFSSKNPELDYTIIAKADVGYGVAVKKGSPLKDQINAALQSLENKGELHKLKQKWLPMN